MSLPAPSDPSAQLHGIDIAKLLSSESPVVKCVLLRATPASDEGADQKLPAKKMAHADDDNKKPVLVDLIDEIEIDTTPKKQMVNKILKGPFTFLGQFEDEGIVLMASRPSDEEEEEDESKLLPINPHQLQPPLDDMQVRGDILVMKVAPTDEVLDNDNDDDEEEHGEQKQVVVPPGDEFFLDYTKEEYIVFASRTDIVAQERPEESSDGEEEIEETDDDGEEEYVAEDDEDDEDDKEHHVAMMNLIMGQLLRRFQEENGRGPDTRELLEIRSALAEKMGIDVPEIDVEGADWDQKVEKKPSKVVESETDPKSPTRPILVNKRGLDEEESPDATAQETKKVKFSEPANEPEAKVTPESEKATADA